MNKTNILRPHLIALDTWFFKSKNFNYKSRYFNILHSLVNRGEIHLVLTQVVYLEILSDIKEGAEEICKAAKGLISKESRICNNSILVKKFIDDAPDAKSIENELLAQFHDFITSAKVEILSIQGVSSQEVFSLYFSRKPPFSKISKNKKYEFPDAFSLLSLDNTATERDDSIYVVSNDKDLGSYCEDKEKLIYFADLSELLNYLLSEFGLDFEESEIYKILEENIKNAEKEIEAQFRKIPLVFENPSNHYLVNPSEEGFDIKVESIEDICLHEKLLIEVQELEDNQFICLFDAGLDITFSADVNCTDVEYSYSKDDYIETPFNVSIKRTLSLPTSISMVLDRDKEHAPKFLAFQDIELNPTDFLDVVYISSERDDFHRSF